MRRSIAKKPVTIVTYHSIGGSRDPYTISPDAFARQIQLIGEHYTVLPLDDIRRVLTSDDLQSRAVIITFDDAFLDFSEQAYPVLEKAALPSTVFVPVGFVGGYNDWDAAEGACRRKPLMTRSNLRAMHETGMVNFGSHTVDHVRMTGLSPEGMRRQARDSKAALEDLIGAPVTTFAYPYGQLDDFSGATTEVLAEAGYSIAVTSHWGTQNSYKEVLRLRRISFAEGDSDSVLRGKIEGRYDWIALKERVGYAIRSLKHELGIRRARA